MNARVSVHDQLNPGQHTTALRAFVADSPLLMDEGQKAEVARRMAQQPK